MPTVHLPKFVVDQYKSKYRAAKELIEAVLEARKVRVRGPKTEEDRAMVACRTTLHYKADAAFWRLTTVTGLTRTELVNRAVEIEDKGMRQITLCIPRCFVEQFENRYTAAKSLIEAVCGNYTLLLERPESESPIDVKHDWHCIKCQTWLTPEQDSAFRDKAKQLGFSLSRTARETIRLK